MKKSEDIATKRPPESTSETTRAMLSALRTQAKRYDDQLNEGPQNFLTCADFFRRCDDVFRGTAYMLDSAINVIETKGQTQAYYAEACIAAKKIIDASDEVLKCHDELFAKDHVFDRMADVVWELTEHLESIVEDEKLRKLLFDLYRLVEERRKRKQIKKHSERGNNR
jgi:hypothetical protein